MKEKKLKKNLRKTSSSIPARSSSGLSFRVSSNIVFGFFIVFSFFITALLYAASVGVENISVVHIKTFNPNVVMENNIRKLVDGFPIENMTPLIAKRNKTTAAFLVGIAKKEDFFSPWGMAE